MTGLSIRKSLARYHFLRELHVICRKNGIAPYRSPVKATVKRKGEQSKTEEIADIKIGKVMLYMELHLTEPLDLEKIANEAGLSKYQLIRRFKIESGDTPWAWLMKKRVEKAQELLAKGWPLVQVATETGFYDQSHMNRVFKETTGTTPKRYQQNCFSLNK